MNKLARHHSGRDVISQLHEDINRLLSPFDLRYEYATPGLSMSEWLPNIDIKEDDKQYIVRADVPGVKASDIDLHMENGVLTIKGKRESERKEEKENYLRIERSSGSFMRQIALPDAVDSEKIQAKCCEGVLEITLPKAAQSIGRKIKVSEG